MSSSNQEIDRLFNAFQDNNFGRDICFLCGEELNSENRSDEHVFPRWVQERFDLWDQNLTLLNGTLIPYRKLKIPCCRTCNNDYLSPIEREICDATSINANEIRNLDNKVIFQWLSKIFYGLLYREFLLPINRSQPDDGPIIPEELLKKYKLHHLFLQSARLPMSFNHFPASIFVFDLHEFSDDINYDFRDDFNLMTISIRLGKIGIIAALQDGGALAVEYTDYFEKFYHMKLHPLQFNELIAKFFYKTYLLNRVPKYMISENDNEIKVLQLPLMGMSSLPLFNEWDQEVYAKFLSQIVEIPFDKVFNPPDKTMSWLYDDNNQLRIIEEIE